MVPSVAKTLTESSGSMVEGFTVIWKAPSSVLIVCLSGAVAEAEPTAEAKDTTLAVFPTFVNILL